MSGGIILKSGREVNSSSQIHDLSPEELEELAGKPVNILMYFNLRQKHHDVVGQLQTISDRLSNIEEALVVTVPANGDEPRKVGLNVLLLEMYKREKSKRRWIAVKDYLGHNKKIITVLAITSLATIVLLKNHIATVITWLADLIITIFKLT